MHPAPRTQPRRTPVLAALPLLVAACGGAPPPPAAIYNAEQLNALAGRTFPDDSLGPAGAMTASSGEVPGDMSGGGGDAPAPTPAGLRIIHASPDRAAASVSAFLDASQVAAAQGVGYKSISGYLELTPGEHALVVRGARAAATAAPVLTATTPALEPSARYTAIVYGLAAGAPHVALAAAQDDLTQPDAGKARVRFFHAIVGLGAVDVCLPGTAARPAVVAAPNRPATPAVAAVAGAPVFANVAYGAFATASQGAYAEVPAGAAVRLQVRAQNARPCAGLLRGTVTVTPADRAVVTAVAVGRATGAPPVARELLVCTDAPLSGPPSCAAAPIR